MVSAIRKSISESMSKDREDGVNTAIFFPSNRFVAAGFDKSVDIFNT